MALAQLFVGFYRVLEGLHKGCTWILEGYFEFSCGSKNDEKCDAFCRVRGYRGILGPEPQPPTPKP